MLDHVSFGTNDIDRAHAFYEPLMKLIGLRLIKKDKTGAHYGVSEILFSIVKPVNGKPAAPGNGDGNKVEAVCYSAK